MGVFLQQDGVRVRGSDGPGGSGWGVGLGDGPVLAMSVRRFEGFRAGGVAPLAVFSSRGDGALGSVARSAQKRQRFCGRDCLVFTWERPGKSWKVLEGLRESFKKLSRGR